MKNALESDHDLIKKDGNYWDKVAPKGATHFYPVENLWLQCSESGGWFSHWFQNGWRKMSFAVWLDIKRDVIKKPKKNYPQALPEIGEIWRHKNGTLYLVIALANRKTERPYEYPVTVVYKNIETGEIWCRPHSNWDKSFAKIEISHNE